MEEFSNRNHVTKIEDGGIVPVTSEDLFEVESQLDMPLEELRTLPVARITEAMYTHCRRKRKKIFF